MSLGLDGLGAGVEWNGVGWRGITWSGEEERDVPTTNPSLPQDFSFVDFALVGKSRGARQLLVVRVGWLTGS